MSRAITAIILLSPNFFARSSTIHELSAIWGLSIHFRRSKIVSGPNVFKQHAVYAMGRTLAPIPPGTHRSSLNLGLGHSGYLCSFEFHVALTLMISPFISMHFVNIAREARPKICVFALPSHRKVGGKPLLRLLLVMFWLWPQAKKPWLLGFGTKAKAKPKSWPGQSQAKKPRLLDLLYSIDVIPSVVPPFRSVMKCNITDSHSNGINLMKSHGSGQSQAKPSQGQLFWPGLVFQRAKATPSRAKAMAFRPSQSQDITSCYAIGLRVVFEVKHLAIFLYATAAPPSGTWTRATRK
ncbi:hypothetical protein B0H11DRAFT_1914639 [Mycena galericulata]|nr:hypothetical protein B0H11DRAFT_1914639 [Mycena galericulata]